MDIAYGRTYELPAGVTKKVFVKGSGGENVVEITYQRPHQTPERYEFHFENGKPAAIVDSTGLLAYSSMSNAQYRHMFQRARFSEKGRDDVHLAAKDSPRWLRRNIERCLEAVEKN